MENVATKFLEEGLASLERIMELEEELKKRDALIAAFTGTKIRTDSQNSNKPPSSDIHRSNRRSRRKKTGKKIGGQKGHKGHHLKFSDKIDEEIHHYPDNCIKCGAVLSQSHAIWHASRQVIDIPAPPPPIVIQHNTYSIPCKCGCWTESAFPADVNAHVQYGSRFRALSNYFSVRQYLPFARLKELFSDCFGLSVSTGTIANSLKRSAAKSESLYKKIKTEISKSEVVGSDETSLYVNGKRHILWVWQNKRLTYLKVTQSRHGAHIREEFPDGFPNSVLCSDRYAAQLNTPAKAHQSCFAHIDRKLIYLAELQASGWVKNIRELFYRAIDIKKKKGYFQRKSKRVRLIEAELNHLLLKQLEKGTNEEIVKFQQSLKRDRDTLLNFLYYKDVPPDNNGSEQAIRCAKVKMKISGGFKSLQNEFAITRSIIDTAIKKNIRIFDLLMNIENNRQITF